LQADQSSDRSFDALTSLNSGQAFLWEKKVDSWYGIDGEHIFKVSIRDKGIEFSSHPKCDSWEHEYFRLGDSISEVRASLSFDPLLASLFNRYNGLRLLRQDPEQCLFSFICASNTNIPMIRRMLYGMARKFGTRRKFDGHEFSTFPSASSINKASLPELQSCGLGYRAKEVQAAAEKITDGTLDLKRLKHAGYADAKEQLLEVYGIGNKIADCILLFSLEKLEAFPIDVWIARALQLNYAAALRDCKIGEKLSARQYETISSKIRVYFGKYAGYAQQYLYYHVRQSAGRRW
jgi:N-glycosylase/DNA lyase